MTRAPLLLLVPILALAALPARAQERVSLEGELVVREGALLLRASEGLVAVRGEVERLAPLVGRTVTLEGTRDQAGLRCERLLAPERETGDAALEDGALRLADGARLRPVDPAHLLPAKGGVTPAFYRFGLEAVVVGVEATTTNTWTLLRRDPSWRALPAGLIRGRDRAVWIEAASADGEFVRIRRGDLEGWVVVAAVARRAPTAPTSPPSAATDGAAGHVPR